MMESDNQADIASLLKNMGLDVEVGTGSQLDINRAKRIVEYLEEFKREGRKMIEECEGDNKAESIGALRTVSTIQARALQETAELLSSLVEFQTGYYAHLYDDLSENFSLDIKPVE